MLLLILSKEDTKGNTPEQGQHTRAKSTKRRQRTEVVKIQTTITRKTKGTNLIIFEIHLFLLL
jgi:hypothetical protein